MSLRIFRVSSFSFCFEEEQHFMGEHENISIYMDEITRILPQCDAIKDFRVFQQQFAFREANILREECTPYISNTNQQNVFFFLVFVCLRKKKEIFFKFCLKGLLFYSKLLMSLKEIPCYFDSDKGTFNNHAHNNHDFYYDH